MFSDQEKAKCVLLLSELKSVTLVQRAFRRTFNKAPPHKNNINRWSKQFINTGSVKKQSRPGRPPVSNQTVEDIRLSCVRSPKKSLPRRSLELGIPVSTLHKVLHKRLHLHAYKIQLLQKIKTTDLIKRAGFATFMLNQMAENESFLNEVVFSDEATFHISGCVNRHNVRIWGAQHPHETFEKERDSPKINVWCGLSREEVIGPFFFAEKTINGNVYLDMLENYCFPQLDDMENANSLYFQQDGAPPHYKTIVRDALDVKFPNRWIGRGGPIAWSPRSPDLTPCDFFLWGHVKNIVYAQKIRNLDHLRERIIHAVSTVTKEMLQNVWAEVDYRLDVCRARNGGHVELY